MIYTDSKYEELVKQINALQDNVNNLQRNAVSQQQTENDLETSEKNLSAILEKNADGIVIVDTDGIVLYVNPAAEMLFGRNKEKFIGYPFGFPVSTNKAEDTLVILKKDTFCEAEFRVVSVNWDKRKAFQLSVRDITVRKQTEKALRESETRHRTLVQTIPDLIWLKDKEGIYLSCNTMFGRFFGATEADIAGKTDYDFVGRELADFFRENDYKAMELGKPSVNEEWITFADDGHKACLETIKAPTYNSEGTLTGVLGIARDITRRKKAEAELIKARDKAEEGDKLKTAFLHNISHEIRTPMNAITGFSALLGEPDLTPETQKYYIEIITQSSDHLLDVLNDIIEISNIEAGILKLKKNEINLNSLIAKLFKQFKHTAIEKGIEFRYTTGLPDDQADIVTDYAKLIQILSNLIGNALKFTIRGEIKFGYELKKGNLEFFVSDTGISIPADQQSKIFDRFYQVEYSATRQFEGTGLGLSISKEYIELMDGNIWLTSEPGHGSVFYFSIPYEEVETQKHFRSAAFKAQYPLAVGQKTLLVAEDDNNNFHLIRELLSELNVKIVRAKNGIEAVDISKSGLKIDLILMDIKMPLMDGYTAIRKILDHAPEMKIIAQTAYGDDEARSMEAGCAGFISKPFVKKQFIKLVKEFFIDTN